MCQWTSDLVVSIISEILRSRTDAADMGNGFHEFHFSAGRVPTEGFPRTTASCCSIGHWVHWQFYGICPFTARKSFFIRYPIICCWAGLKPLYTNSSLRHFGPFSKFSQYQFRANGANWHISVWYHSKTFFTHWNLSFEISSYMKMTVIVFHQRLTDVDVL